MRIGEWMYIGLSNHGRVISKERADDYVARRLRHPRRQSRELDVWYSGYDLVQEGSLFVNMLNERLLLEMRDELVEQFGDTVTVDLFIRKTSRSKFELKLFLTFPESEL